MHVVVCVKQTPDSAARMGVDPGGRVTADTNPVVNPWDDDRADKRQGAQQW